MALSTATITMDLADMLGVDFDTRRTKVYVSTNIPGDTIVDTTGNKIRLGDGKVTPNDDGTALVSVWVPGTGSNPASWQTYITVDYAPRSAKAVQDRKLCVFGPFTIVGNADLADLIEEQEVPPAYLTALTTALDGYVSTAAASASSASTSAAAAAASAATAHDISGISTPDSAVAALMGDSGSSTYSRTVAKFPTTASGATLQQLLAASSDAGGFYQGYDHSQVFESGVHDPIHSMGYNFSAARGRVNNSYGALGWAIEGRYKYGGEIIQEWYVQHVPRAGKTTPGGGVGYRRPIAFSVMEDGDEAATPYLQGHICATGFQFLREDMATQILYVNAAGLEVSVGHDLYLRATSSANSKIMWQKDSTIYGYQAISYGDNSVFLYDAQNARVHEQHFWGADAATARTDRYAAQHLIGGAHLKLDSTTAGNSHVQFQVDGSTKFYQTIFRGDPNLYLWNAQNNRAQVAYTAGSSDTAALADFSSNVKVRGNVGFYGTTPATKPTVSGSRGGNAALASLLTGLASLGLVTDSSTA